MKRLPKVFNRPHCQKVFLILTNFKTLSVWYFGRKYTFAHEDSAKTKWDPQHDKTMPLLLVLLIHVHCLVYIRCIPHQSKSIFKFRARETCVSWFGPSEYYEVADDKGNVEFIVQGPGGCVFECRRPSVFRVRAYKCAENLIHMPLMYKSVAYSLKRQPGLISDTHVSSAWGCSICIPIYKTTGIESNIRTLV